MAKCYTKVNDNIKECSNDYFESLKRQVILLECLMCHDRSTRMHRIKLKGSSDQPVRVGSIGLEL